MKNTFILVTYDEHNSRANIRKVSKLGLYNYLIFNVRYHPISNSKKHNEFIKFVNLSSRYDYDEILKLIKHFFMKDPREVYLDHNFLYNILF